jgi:lysophospholipase L1-like esterase
MSATERAPARYLALGDSYTIGEGVADGERWPSILVRLLAAEGVHVSAPRIVAVTGWTTDELAAGIREADPEGENGLVTLLIGVNDQYRERPLEGYRAGFTELLETAIGFAGGEPGRVVVLSIPDWGPTPFAAGRDRDRIALEIDLFNAANREITLARGAHHVDVTASSRATSALHGYLAEDGLHPAGPMYEEWARLALPAALAALASRPPGRE